MRTRTWLFGAAALAICLLLILARPAKQKESQRAEIPARETSPVAVSGTLSTSAPAPALAIPPKPSLPPDASPLAHAIAETNPIAARRLANWQGSIEFYGKVADENSNAIPGATVVFHWVELPSATGNRSLTTRSDAEGLFSLRGERGPSLSITISKEGYYPATGGAQYGATAISEFSPDPRNPVIIRLRKKGEGAELITSGKGIQLKVGVQVPKNNIPVRVDLLKKEASPTGQLEIRQDKPLWQEAKEWSFKMSIPDGGFVENVDEFQFEAPNTNYAPAVEFHFTKSGTNWTTQVNKQFYIAFGQPRKYGWLRIESNLAQETVFLTYAINPDGSRNLEPQ